GRQWNGFWWDEQADFSARQGHRVGTPSLEIVHDFDVPGTGRVREDSLSELIPDNLIDLKACRLIRHQRLNALRLEAAGVEILEHCPWGAQNGQRRIATAPRHCRDRIDH